MGKRFKNNKLRKISPEGLLSSERTRGNEREISELFLTLALVFNDLKGLMILQDTFVDVYEKPSSHKPSGHLGEYNGMKLQALRLLFGYLAEFLRLLKEEQKLIGSPDFKIYEQEMSEDSLELWETLNLVANSKTKASASKRAQQIEKLLVAIRNNSSFHYYQSGKTLALGFEAHFHNSDEDEVPAYFSSLKSDFAKTRYYYIDAAFESFLTSRTKEIGNTAEVVDQVFELAAYTLKAIVNLLDAYHDTKPMM